MPLSEWPAHWKGDDDGRNELVIAEFEAGEMYVAVVTDKAIGLTEEIGDDVSVWLPKSQLKDVPDKGDWIDSIQIPKWLAEDKGLEY